MKIVCRAAVLVTLAIGSAHATPFLPPNDSVVLEHLPDGRDPVARDLRVLNTALAASPNDRALAVRVAARDIALSRRRADPRWLGRAEAALAPFPAGPDAPADTNLLHATILQSNHDFPASLAVLGYVLARDPGNFQALLTRASVEIVRADYPAGRADCGRLAGAVIGLVPDTCTAAVMAMMGHAPQALRALTLSMDQNSPEKGDVRVWAATLAAEIAARLDDLSAETRFHTALSLDGEDPYLLGAWSDWLLDHGRPNDVVQLLSNSTRIDPLLLRLTIAEAQLGSPDAAGHVADLGARFDAARLRGETVHRREEARFTLTLLRQPQAALKLAQANWGVQREPADARILLECALAAHDPAAAAPVRAWMHDNAVQGPGLADLAARLDAIPRS